MTFSRMLSPKCVIERDYDQVLSWKISRSAAADFVEHERRGNRQIERLRSARHRDAHGDACKPAQSHRETLPFAPHEEEHRRAVIAAIFVASIHLGCHDLARPALGGAGEGILARS